MSVTATDPGGLTDTVTVTITVEDVDETPVVSGPPSVNIRENGGEEIDTYTSTDPDEEGIDLGSDGRRCRGLHPQQRRCPHYQRSLRTTRNLSTPTVITAIRLR